MKSKTISLQKEEFFVECHFDYGNDRLRIIDYRGNVQHILNEVERILEQENFSKIIFYSRTKDWRSLLSKGFILEGVFSSFLNGTDCYVMSLFKSENRKTSNHWMKEDEILTTILEQKKNNKLTPPIPITYSFRRATKNDADELATLYKQVFKVYPVPIDDTDYIRKCMEKGSIFYVVEYDKKIVSAASADVNMKLQHAELTDCATLPEHRKYGLIKKLLTHLEDELVQQGIFCAFSLARALSFGMNAAFYQLGYEYGGRLMNNCYIFDKIEDMNIWVKDLS